MEMNFELQIISGKATPIFEFTLWYKRTMRKGLKEKRKGNDRERRPEP